MMSGKGGKRWERGRSRNVRGGVLQAAPALLSCCFNKEWARGPPIVHDTGRRGRSPRNVCPGGGEAACGRRWARSLGLAVSVVD